MRDTVAYSRTKKMFMLEALSPGLFVCLWLGASAMSQISGLSNLVIRCARPSCTGKLFFLLIWVDFMSGVSVVVCIFCVEEGDGSTIIFL
jgi:hypothetical protein